MPYAVGRQEQNWLGWKDTIPRFLGQSQTVFQLAYTPITGPEDGCRSRVSTFTAWRSTVELHLALVRLGRIARPFRAYQARVLTVERQPDYRKTHRSGGPSGSCIRISCVTGRRTSYRFHGSSELAGSARLELA